MKIYIHKGVAEVIKHNTKNPSKTQNFQSYCKIHFHTIINYLMTFKSSLKALKKLIKYLFLDF